MIDIITIHRTTQIVCVRPTVATFVTHSELTLLLGYFPFALVLYELD
jgi:hypothetical protein